MRRLLILLILCAVVAVVADRVIVDLAERRAEAEVVERAGFAADVELQGTLTGLRLLLGTAPLVTADARDVELAGRLRLTRLRAELTDVRVSLDMSAPTARTADFEAQVDGAALTELLPLTDGVDELRLDGDRLVIVIAGRIELEAGLNVGDGSLLVTLPVLPDIAGAPDVLPRLDLVELPGEPEIREAEIRDGRLILRGVLRELLRDDA